MMRPLLLVHIVLTISLLSPESPAPKPADKTVAVRRVYARLLQTIGNPADAPTLQVLARAVGKPTGQLVYSADPARIDIGEDVLDLCATFGDSTDAALACLLGHELAHFQYRHGSKQGFFSPIIGKNDSAYSSENLEATADRSGVFTAYLAGYNAFGVAPVIYRAFYDTFKKPDQLPGYPAKSQRLQMVTDTTTRVQELAQLFEIGEIRYLLHDFDGASRDFDALTSRYPSSTTVNNLGAIKLNQALGRMELARNNPKLRFLFPVEFDSDNRLLTSTLRDNSSYQQLLTEAKKLFTNALTKQPTHQAAALNLAIATYLLGDSEQARQTLLRYISPLSANAQLMMGIVQADLGQIDAARKSFKLAVEKKAFRAVDNQKYFEEGQKPGWQQWFNQAMAKYQVKETAPTPLPAWPDKMILAKYPPVIVLPGDVKIARTGSLTSYQLRITSEPVTNETKNVRYRVLKSSQVPLKGLDIHKAPNQHGTPATIIAGARATVFYGYRKAKQWLFLEYRDNQLISWIAAEPI
ncbi:tetratricopeptide repeat protein [Spirosoma gilvum]